MGAVLFASVPVAQAATLQEQINALNSQISQQQKVAQNASGRVDTLNGQLTQLSAQINAVEAQIAVTQLKQRQTRQRIEEAKVELVKKRNSLNESIRSIYQQSQVTPLEMLASSKTFADFVDKQQYLDEIKSHVQDGIKEVNQLRADLEKQEADLNVQAQQIAGLSATLQEQRNQQSQLLLAAQGDQDKANKAIQAKSAEVQKLQAQQAAALASASSAFNGSIPGASGGSGGACDNGHGNGGYPMKWCDAPQDSLVDSWGMYNRECTSWAAWRRAQIGRGIPGGWGDAKNWGSRAQAAGYHVDGSPEVGAIAWSTVGQWGHVAVVEAIQGNNVIVSELNYDMDGHFRMGVYPISYYQYIH